MNVGLIVDGYGGFGAGMAVYWDTWFNLSRFGQSYCRLWQSSTALRRWELRWRLAQFVRQQDVVFCDWVGQRAIELSLLGMDTPLVVRLHSYELFDVAAYVEWSSVDTVVVVSEAMHQHFVSNVAFPSDRCVVVGYGVDLSRFTMRERRYAGRVGMLCNVVPIKRVYEVMLAVREARRRGHDFHLTIAGPVPEGDANQERYRIAVGRLVDEMAGAVELLGPISSPEVFLGSIDIFVSGSYWEGQQNALLEAMASGALCVSHRWHGADELLSDPFLYWSETELVELLVRLSATGDAERSLIARQQRLKVEADHDLEHVALQFARIFQILAQRQELRGA